VFCGAHYLISKQFSSTARSFSHRGNSSRNSHRKLARKSDGPTAHTYPEILVLITEDRDCSHDVPAGCTCRVSRVQCASGMVIEPTMRLLRLSITIETTGFTPVMAPDLYVTISASEKRGSREEQELTGKTGRKGSGELGKLNHRLHLRGCQRGRWLPLETNLE